MTKQPHTLIRALPALAFCLGVSLATTPSTSWAASPKYAERATKGASEPAVQTLTRSQLRSFHLVPELQLKEVQALARAGEERVTRVLTRQDQARLSSMEQESRAIAEIKDPRRRAAEIAAFNKRNAAFRASLQQRSGLSDAAAMTRARQIFPQYEFSRKSGLIIGTRKTGLSAPTASLPDKPPPAGDPNYVEILEFEQRLQRSMCVNEYTPSFREDSFGGFQFSALANGCHSDVALGAVIDVPAGVDEVDVEVELEEYNLRAVAMGLAGYGQANTDLGLRISGPGIDRFELDRSVVAIAPLAALIESREEVDGSFTMTTTFAPRNQGGRYTVQVYGGLFTMGVVGGWGIANFSVPEMRAIRVHYRR